MSDFRDKITECVSCVKSFLNDKGLSDFVPKVAITLGSGLGEFAQEARIIAEISYGDIPGFPVSTVPGHDGRFLFGYVGEVPAVIMKGRVHYYEGYPITDVVLPLRIMRLLGAEIFFVTNAAGGINRSFKPGDFMLIKDHIASFMPSPLIGPNVDFLGTRFPDMSQIYDPELGELVRKTAAEIGADLKEGVYIQVSGPQYENPTEIKLYGKLGADAVGMSTAVEAIAARHAGMRVCGISLISNMACGISKTKLSHKEVQETADKAGKMFRLLLKGAVCSL